VPPWTWPVPSYEVRGVQGLPEVRPGDDVAALIAGAVDLQDGDVVVVTSKLVSKAEGRLVPVPDGADREAVRLAAVAAETVREVARRGTAVIAENRNGLVLAAAGVDARGRIGDTEPMQAAEDALRWFAADGVMLVCSPPGRSRSTPALRSELDRRLRVPFEAFECAERELDDAGRLSSAAGRSPRS